MRCDQRAQRAGSEFHRCVRSAKRHSVQEMETAMQYGVVVHITDECMRHCRFRRCTHIHLGFDHGQLQVCADGAHSAGDHVEIGSERQDSAVRR